MTDLDLTKSRFLLPALQNLIECLTKLSKNDTPLNNKVYQLHHFISSPADVNGEELQETLDATKDLAAGYDLDKENKLLPAVFQSAISELEHLIQSKKLTQMDDKFSAIQIKVKHFHKLAIGG